MIYSAFVALVIEELGVNGTRRGLETQRARWIRDAVIDLQRFIRAYQQAHQTSYSESDLTEKGYAHLGTLPTGAKPRAFYTVSEVPDATTGDLPDPNTTRNRMEQASWVDRQAMLDGRYDVRSYTVAISPHSKQFLVHPLVNDETYLLLVWDGLKMDFADGDVVPFPEQAAEAVASYVLWKILKFVDKNIALAREEYGAYVLKRLSLFREENEAQFIDNKDEEYLEDPLNPPIPVSAELAEFGAQSIPFLKYVTQLVGADGDVTALSAVPTLNLSVPFTIEIKIGGVIQTWVLQSGTAATASGIQRPNDYDAATNAKVWVQLS